MTKPMRTCPECGAWLDSGERCDCRDGITNNTAPEAGSAAGQLATANPPAPVLTAGA